MIIIQPFLNKYGGAERKTLLFYQYLKMKGHSCNIVCYKYDFSLCNDICNDLDESDIIHLKSTTLYFWIIKVVYFLHSKNTDKFIFAMNYPANIAAGIFKIINNSSVNTYWMCNEVSSIVNKRSRLKQLIFSFFESFIASRLDVVICNSLNTSRALKHAYDITCKKVVYSGINTEIFDTYRNHNIGSDNHHVRDIDFLYLGRIERHKSVDEVLSVAKKYPQSRVTVAGVGSYTDEFKNKCLKVKNLTFIGRVTNDEKLSILHRSKVLLFPSHNEPLGVVIMEAIYAGCWVIAYDSAGPSEIIRRDLDGILAISSSDFIYRSNPEFTPSFSESRWENSRDYINSNFSNKSMLSSLYSSFYGI